MRKDRRKNRAAWVGALILAGAVSTVSYVQAAKMDFDFHHFYRDAHYVWQHAALNPDRDNPDPLQRRQLPFYLPVVPLLLSPLTAGGVKPAALLWSLMHGVSLLVSLWLLRGWTPLRRGDGIPALAVACAVALPAIYETAHFSQISFVILALLLGGYAALERGHKVGCGALLGFATVLKLLPGVLLVWLALKRQWTALAATIITIALLAWTPCMIVFGPTRTAAYHREWIADNFGNDALRGVIDRPQRSHFVDYRNQSIAAVLERAFWPQHPAKASWQPLKLSRAACVRISLSVTAALALGLMLATHRRFSSMTRAARQCEWAAYLVAMLVFSPLLRQYYLVWCLPALAVFSALAANDGSPRARYLGRAGLAVWLAGMIAWLWPTARTYGGHLIMLVFLAALLLAAARTGGDARRPPCNNFDNRQNQPRDQGVRGA